ncbi:hypothetical protein PIB30_057766 [Stylosanthes scabra]|uniref:Trichome birefringence-like N-terminal domain-containing protein n=1 Tax=Stylosanthes scabra TaxID=79078 RepID=A0ABU6QK41_9FABA|nr:hypothetical protein [Stylosanthes scabra]
MAFVGDSMGRNQMDSLICLLNTEGRFEDITERYTSKDDVFFRWWFSESYNFTLTILWAPFLVKATGADLRGKAFDGSMNLYLDEPNDAWVSKVEDFDYVIFSSGQWFYRPLTFYEKGQNVGSQQGGKNMKDLNLYGYKKAFQTSFRTIINLTRFKGLTFLVTQSAKHFEHGEYNQGGNCNRTKPFTEEERQGYNNGELLEAMHHAQVDEFRKAENEGRRKGLQFGLIDISEATSMRPDGHPDKYGLSYNKNAKILSSNQSSSEVYAINTLNNTTEETRKCNIFSGDWSPYPEGAHYNNDTCPYIIEHLNCIKFGRPDREFLKLRWKPYDSELPLFSAKEFLRLVQGKSMAFVGDSMARNQIASLLCLINSVANPVDVTRIYTSKENARYVKLWYSIKHNFTLTMLWSPFLVKAIDDDPYGYDHSHSSAMNLYLDEPDEAWVNRIVNFDYVIISTGQWFLRPMNFFEKSEIVANKRRKDDIEHNLYGYKKAFQTCFRTLINLKGFKGSTFLVTHSPNHFEYEKWNEGGYCNRTKPFTKEEMLNYYNNHGHGDVLKSFHDVQVEEFREAEKEARKKGLQFGLIDVSDAMAMRPDGHPGKYGHLYYSNNAKVTDCVHWCLPGPVDTWNEFLLYLLKMQM